MKYFAYLSALIAVVSFLILGKTHSKNNSLTSQLAEAEYQLELAKDKIDEFEEQFSEVQHFDEFGGVSPGYASQRLSFKGSVYETQIDGEFNGWEGETIFKMVDGSIWQQASYDYTYHYAYMPSVILYKKGGSYYMHVEDVDDEIRVTRIK